LGKSWAARPNTSSRFFSQWIDGLPDPRQEWKSDYDKALLFWCGLSIFLLGMGSRRQFDRECDDDSGVCLENLNQLAGTHAEFVPHNITVSDYLKQIPLSALEEFPAKMVGTLIRSRVLEKNRLFGKYYTIAIDATGYQSFTERHCEHCLTQTKNGKTIYYHLVLEAKLITPGGLALSLGTEFVENFEPAYTRQDCELKAFPRLARRIKARFPQLQICLLGDALYSNQGVFDLCEELNWKWVATFKSGRLPTAFLEFQKLKVMTPENHIEHREAGRYQRIAWVNDLEHEGHRFGAFDCLTYNRDHEQQYFAWITNLPVRDSTVRQLTNEGGRLRWKIENEGFNIQKNYGYALEHTYCHDLNGGKNYYYLLQIAHIILQLLLKGSLKKAFKRRIETLRNFFRRLAESLRNALIRAEEIADSAARSIQIRLDSS
jgi:hypothetical protein